MKDSETGARNKRFLWRCRDCKRQYTVRIGTVFEDSRIPLQHWCFAFWAATSSKKGVSALQIKRQAGVTYKSALFMMHRIRYAMAPTSDGPKLGGTVEVDETYVGGKPRFRIPHARTGPNRPKHRPKQPVLGAVSKETGQLRVRVIPDVTSATLRSAVNDLVDKSANLETDEALIYRPIGREYASHKTVFHSIKEYVCDGVTTNTIESFFAILKRGLNGIYHNVSRKHLQRYCDEFEFRYNTRKVGDGARLRLAVQGAEGKRLMYREPVAE